MTNFIFKSQGTYKKLASQLDMILSEQRNQRADLQEVLFQLHKLLTNADLQTQVEDFYAGSIKEQEKDLD